MVQIRRAWQEFFITPFTWIFFCFFQPTKFKRDIEVQGVSKRFVLMWRMALPLFLCAYPLALVTRIVLCLLFPAIYYHYFPQTYHCHFFTVPPPYCQHLALSYSIQHLNLVNFVIDATWAPLLVIIVAVLGGAVFGLTYGIAGGIAGGFWGSVAVYTGLGTPGYIAVASTVCAMLGITVGIAIGSARDITRSSGVGTGIGSAVGIVVGILLGMPVGIVGADVGGNFIYNTLDGPKDIIGSIAGAIMGVICAALVVGIAIGILRGSLRTRTLAPGVERGFSVGTAVCFAASAAVGGTMGTAFGSRGDQGLILGLTTYIIPNLPVVPVFLISYMLGYYRLPLYPASGLSSLSTYLVSRKNPPKVFEYLHRSSLYWDESVFLPLPGLKGALLLAVEQDIARTLEEITFIITERPLQMTEARPVSLEIALSDLEGRESLRHIAQAHERLAEIFPHEAGLIDPRWVAPFARLNDASREAARYSAPLGRQARRAALDEMVRNLKRVRPERAFEDMRLNTRLRMIIGKWLAVAKQELDRLEQASEEIGYIDNPYISGSALKSNNSLFVGRRDLVRQLEQALNRGVYRPSFFLTGERRMGKTSTLNQLSILLGARYLPITFDLQSRGISSSAAAFLNEIAEAIYKVLDVRGIRIKKLEYVLLKEASHENEAATYRLFDAWFKDVESLLEQEERTLLIAFDEFEKLEEVGQARYLDLNLLLDWFRSVIQNRSRLALLFSGVRTLGDMGANWAGYFVNVKVLRVSFLHPVDARRLITQPVPEYPGEEIFREGVVEEIMRVTGGHPFLIQAICSELIDALNTDVRDQAYLQDVEIAVDNVLESWWETYFRDLWERTSQEQRTCLKALRFLGKAPIQQVRECCEMDERTVQHTLQTLLKRDLVLREDDLYRIAAPIFSQWVERNS